MRNLLHSDNGFGKIKLFDECNYLDISSLVCKREDVKIIQEPYNTKDILIATVNGEEIVVGNKAVYGRARFNHQTDKISAPQTIYPTIIGFAFLLLSKNINSSTIDITTTLPIDLHTEKNISKFKNKLCKEWNIKFHYGHLRNKEVKFRIENILTSAQCSVGIWDYLLNNDARIIKPVINKKYLGIDIGYESTDVCVLDNLNPDSLRSKSLDIGVSDYNEKIVKEINDKFNMRKSVEEMEKELKLGRIGNTSIIDIQTKYYKKMVEEILNSISGFITTTIEFEDILIFGGGAYKSINIFRNIKGYERSIMPNKPEYSNVRGNSKLAKMIWKGREYDA